MALPWRLVPIVGLMFLILAVPAWGASPVMEPSVTIDGPGLEIQGLTGLSVSRDGTGGLVYLKSVDGIDHVFVSALTGGSFATPVEVDAGLTRPSSQPVIAAGDGGLLLIAFINAGELFVVSRATSSSAFSAPAALYSGASNPAIELSIHSEGYLAFTATDGSGYDVRDLYYSGGQWQLEAGSLNVTPADDAGTGAGAPKVAAAGDGEAIVVWGENGHIYARRVWYDMTSYEVEQADVASMDGFTEVTADSPAVATEDNSSYADVAFREEFTNGSQTISRVLMNRLVGSTFEGIDEADGQSFATGPGATGPGITMMQYGNGFVTSELAGSNQVWATLTGQNGTAGAAQRIDSLGGASPPYATSTVAGDYTGLIAWQHDPGAPGGSDIRARFYTSASFGPEMVASNPSLGATNAAEGLFAGGDHGGDVAIAYVQGSGSTSMIEVSELVYPPGSFGAASKAHYRTTTRPLLSWTAARELWGPLSYEVTVDGVSVGSTDATSLTLPAVLSQGPHTFQVTALNEHGLTSATLPVHFFVDSIRPTAQFRLTGASRVNALLTLRVRSTDSTRGIPRADTSGVKTVAVNWGDGSRTQIRGQRATHRYLRAGRHLLTITVTDRAGNRTVLARRVTIAK